MRGKLVIAAVAGVLAIGGGAAWVAWPDAASPAGRPEPGTPEWDNWEKESIVAGRLAQLSIVQRGEERSRELCDAEWGKLWPEQQAKLDKIAFGSGCILQPPGQ